MNSDVRGHKSHYKLRLYSLALFCLYVSPVLLDCHFLLVKVSCTRPVAVFMFPLPQALRIIKIEWHYAKKLSPLLLATTTAKCLLLCGICQSNFHHLDGGGWYCGVMIPNLVCTSSSLNYVPLMRRLLLFDHKMYSYECVCIAGGQ